jgi:hypothetical protein
MRRVLSLDGGGAKGFMQLAALEALELRAGRRIAEIFDLVAGTSVWAILGALCATGRLSAAEVAALMREVAPKLFHRRPWPLLPKYDRDVFAETWSRLGLAMSMSACRTRYMCTAVNVVDGRTHYFKSWQDKDGGLPLLEAVQRSFAAPLYFGGIVDKPGGAVWLDGGTGSDNAPLLEAAYEIADQGWFEERTHLLSIGCGHVDFGIPFAEASRWFGRNAREVRLYMSPSDGGLARRQSIRTRVDLLERLDAKLDGFSFQRLDVAIPLKLDAIDGIEHADTYYKLGRLMADTIDWGRIVL